MKQELYNIGMIVLVCVIVYLVFIPKSCDKEIESLDSKKDKSLIIDSIVSAQTEKHNAILDSVINDTKKRDSIKSISDRKLLKEYYALRKIVKTLDKVKVDSLTQVVNGVPIEAYNASINSGVMCDELLADKDESLNRKDSIISMREIQISNNNKEIATKEQAIQDLIALDQKKEKNVKHAKSLNKKIPLITSLSALAGVVLAVFILK